MIRATNAEADSQTRTIRGVVDSVERSMPVEHGQPRLYPADIEDRETRDTWRIILDHPLTVGQTYEVEVTVREVE